MNQINVRGGGAAAVSRAAMRRAVPEETAAAARPDERPPQAAQLTEEQQAGQQAAAGRIARERLLRDGALCVPAQGPQPEQPRQGQPQPEQPQGGEADLPSLLSELGKKQEETESLLDMMQEAQKKAKEMREKLKLPQNASRYGYAAIEAYARLSRARTQSQVSAASGYARRQLGQLQTALRQDKDNAGRIKAAIRQLQTAVARAGRKKRELEDERQTEARRARAERESRYGDEKRIRQELRRRQSLRAVRESGYVRGACVDHMQQEQMAHDREQQRQRAEELLGDLTPGAAMPAGTASSVDTALQKYAAQLPAQAAPAPAPAAELSLEI